MRIDRALLKFPKHLPNDLEGFIFFYPNKFPNIINEYEKAVKLTALNPAAFENYGNQMRDELFAGFKKIKRDFENGDQDDLELLVTTDQRFHKLICYRFWVVNYLFPDGPLHDFFVDNLKDLARKFIDVTEEIEDFEAKVVRVQRDLLQGDYADLYLQQALAGDELVKLLSENPKTTKILKEAIKLIDQSKSDIGKINKNWDELIKIIEQLPENDPIRLKLAISLVQTSMRKTMLPVYNMLTHSLEFREENERLAKRHSQMTATIENIMEIAKTGLNKDEFDVFKLSYLQARNYAKYKDVMGEIDPLLLPLWFGILEKIQMILSKSTPILIRPMGHAGMFYHLVWYLPDELKAKVMTPDLTNFSLETL